jgi:uncharacterized protein (TIGR00645 family)
MNAGSGSCILRASRHFAGDAQQYGWPMKPTIETRLEQGLFASRWLMAPMYVGLVGALAMLLTVFMREVYFYALKLPEMGADQGILAILTLIDLSLAANLLLIVLFSGYENFVSKLDIKDSEDRPDWMGKVDFSGLKMKLIASIVAISGIHLLKVFMEIGKPDATKVVTSDQMYLMVVIHLTFVVSGVLLALMDWMSAKTDKH